MDETTTVTEKKKRGRPATGSISPAERKQRSRMTRMLPCGDLEAFSVTALLETYPRALKHGPRLALAIANELKARAQAAFDLRQAPS